MNLIPVAITVLLGCAAVPGAPWTSSQAARAAEITATPGWLPTAHMQTARERHTATLLRDGKVLVAGGVNESGPLDSAELYDAASATWSRTGTLGEPVGGHTATLLHDGTVLVTGGIGRGPGAHERATRLYDPSTGTWRPTGSLIEARHGHAATRLRSGKVLVTGGYGSGYLASAELYDPESGSWSRVSSMAVARMYHSATGLRDGSVLVAGGSDDVDVGSFLSGAEIYDPVADTWHPVASLHKPRENHVATLLHDGRVMVAGGDGYSEGTQGGHVTLSSIELFDPATGRWASGGALVGGYHGFTASGLVDGTILMAGGIRASGGDWHLAQFPAATSRFDPDSISWHAEGDLLTARTHHTATVLADGSVLIAGGRSGYSTPTLASAEILEAATDAAALVNPDQHGLTGSWANPATHGQGLVMEVYPDLDGPGRGALFGGWFTFDAAAAGGQRWYTIQGAVDATAKVSTVSIYQSEGGAFDSPQETTTTEVGQATLQFSDCTHGTLDYRFSDGSGRSGTVPLSRLLQNVSCAREGDNGSAASSYLLSGAWADADAGSGQGLVLDIHPAQNVLFAAWYTFASDATPSSGAGGQHWYTLQARTMPGTYEVDGIGIYETRGGQFDRPASTSTVAVGRARLVFHDCGSATLTYEFDAGRRGTLELARIGPLPRGCAL